MGVLDGKTAIISGAGSGIGRAAAELFSAEGATLVGVDLDAEAAAKTADDLGGVAVVGNVSDPATWEAAVAAADERGGVDVAYLNAGVYGFGGAIDELPIDVYERTVAANIGGVVMGVRAIVPAMRARGGGALVATASVAGVVPFPLNPLYTMTKTAVTGFVQALAPTLAGDGITFDAVCPSIVDTPMTTGALGGADAAELGIAMIPASRIAEVALHLATTEGTGRCFAILDGRDPIPWSYPTWGELLARNEA